MSRIDFMAEAGTVFPNRVWEQDEAGLWYSREATAEDRQRREAIAETLAIRRQ